MKRQVGPAGRATAGRNVCAEASVTEGRRGWLDERCAVGERDGGKERLV